MKKNRLLLIILFLLAVVALVFFLKNNKSTTLLKSESNFAVSDTGSITKIYMVDKQNKEILLEKKRNNRWMINEKYFVSRTAMDVFLEGLANVRVLRPLQDAAHDNMVRMLSVNSKKVEIYTQAYRIKLFGWKCCPHEKLEKVYYVGDNTQDKMGTFMYMKGADRIYITHILGFRGYVGARYNFDEKRWRDKYIFQYGLDDIKEIKVEYPEQQDSSYVIHNSTDLKQSISLLHGNKSFSAFNQRRVLEMLAEFQSVVFETTADYLTENQIDSISHLQAYVNIQVEDRDENKKSIKVYRMGNKEKDAAEDETQVEWDLNRAYASFQKGDIVVVTYFDMEKISRPLSYLLAKED